MVTRSSVRHTREEFISSTPVRLVDEIIARAFTERASDIHFEPVGADCRIRIRTDGILIPGGRYSKLMHEEVISRLKVLAGLRTDIKFLPQDGRFRVNLSNNSVNIRISVVPSIYGEKGCYVFYHQLFKIILLKRWVLVHTMLTLFLKM